LGQTLSLSTITLTLFTPTRAEEERGGEGRAAPHVHVRLGERQLRQDPPLWVHHLQRVGVARGEVELVARVRRARRGLERVGESARCSRARREKKSEAVFSALGAG